MMHFDDSRVSFFSAVVLAAIVIVVVVLVVQSPEEYVKKKYSEDYSIVMNKTSGSYYGILGEDQDNVYLDLFENGKYFGGTYLVKNKLRDTATVYQFQQYETFLAVVIYNPNDKYVSYSLEIGGTNTEPLTLSENIENVEYVLDIYTLDTSYNGVANLELVRNQ